jgi:hypothetical protein
MRRDDWIDQRISSEGEITVGNVAADQRAPGPDPTDIANVEIGQIKIGPVFEPLAFAGRACRKVLPGLRRQVCRDSPSRSAGGMGFRQDSKERFALAPMT